jgi:hypothetical protein
LPKMRQKKLSIQGLISLSTSSKTRTDPEVVIFGSESTKRRIRPLRVASRMRKRASPVVSIHPDQGGSGEVDEACSLLT